MKKIKTGRILMSLLLTLAMVVTLLPVTAMTANAEDSVPGQLTDTIAFNDYGDLPPEGIESVSDDYLMVQGDIYSADDEAGNVANYLDIAYGNQMIGKTLTVLPAYYESHIEIDKLEIPFYYCEGTLTDNLYASGNTVSVTPTEIGGSGTITVENTEKLEEVYLGTNGNAVYLAVPSVTIYYHYEYPITYNCNDGSFNEGYTAPATYTKGVGVTLPTADNISRNGYMFKGWYTSEDFTGDAVTSIGTEDSESKTYYAKWEQKTAQTITASDVTATNGDTGKSISATTSGNGTLSYAIKEGSATDVVDVNASTGALTIKQAGSTTVTVTASETATCLSASKDVAVTIEPRKYTVNFSTNGHGTAPASQTIEEATKLTQPTDLTADGYVFGGWYKDAACTEAWNFSSDTVNSALTLYAKWTRVTTLSDVQYSDTYATYSAKTSGIGRVVTYYKVNGSWQITKPVTEGTYEVGVTVEANSGNTGLGTADSPATEGKTYTVVIYTVTLDGNGGTASATSEDVIKGSTIKATATRSGYNFAGWYTEAEGGTRVTAPTESATLYAHWTKIEEESSNTSSNDSSSSDSDTKTYTSVENTGSNYSGPYVAGTDGSKGNLGNHTTSSAPSSGTTSGWKSIASNIDSKISSKQLGSSYTIAMNGATSLNSDVAVKLGQNNVSSLALTLENSTTLTINPKNFITNGKLTTVRTADGKTANLYIDVTSNTTKDVRSGKIDTQFIPYSVITAAGGDDSSRMIAIRCNNDRVSRKITVTLNRTKANASRVTLYSYDAKTGKLVKLKTVKYGKNGVANIPIIMAGWNLVAIEQ